MCRDATAMKTLRGLDTRKNSLHLHNAETWFALITARSWQMNVKGSKSRQAWERPVLHRLDAADAQMTTAGLLNDGAANKS